MPPPAATTCALSLSRSSFSRRPNYTAPTTIPLFSTFCYPNAGARIIEIHVDAAELDNDNNNGSNDNGNDRNGDESGDSGGDHGSDDFGKNNKALMVLAEAERSVESLPKDLVVAIEVGKVPGAIILKYFEPEKSNLLSWLMTFGGFKERVMAGDLFLAKVLMECGVRMFTKVYRHLRRHC